MDPGPGFGDVMALPTLYATTVQLEKRQEKEKTSPFGVDLMRSLVIYWAAQVCNSTPLRTIMQSNRNLISYAAWLWHGIRRSSLASTPQAQVPVVDATAEMHLQQERRACIQAWF